MSAAFMGSYGGAFVPEILYNNVHQLQLVYKDLIGANIL